MQFEITPRFIKQMRKLKRKDSDREQAIRKTIREFSRLLFYNQPVPASFGLTRLRTNYWEVRASISDRAVFYKKKDLIRWVLAGNHNEVKNFLRTI